MRDLDLKLPVWYNRREVIQYYDDTNDDCSLLIHQPEVYSFAEYLLRKDSRTTLVDLGSGSGRKIRKNQPFNLIGVDQGINLTSFKSRHPSSVTIEHDFESGQIEWPSHIEWHKTVVVCADVIEHLVNPVYLLNEISELSNRGAVVLVSTPDRDRVYRGENYSPPANPSHAQEWNLSELRTLLGTRGIPVAFSGHTISDNFLRLKNTSLIICDKRASLAADQESQKPNLRPLAIIAAFNDADIIAVVCRHYIDNDIDLHLLDNWSDDGTYSQMIELARLFPNNITVERFPADGPQDEYRWTDILDRKAEIAASHEGRWILHVDSDEIRISPWADCTLADALARVARAGYTCTEYCVVNFIPTNPVFDGTDDLYNTFTRFQFGRHPAHFIQRRSWLQPKGLISLSDSGGHIAKFEGALTFPYRFPLLHFPIRSQEHGKRKIHKERRARYSRVERVERGWHNHYDEIPEDQIFISLPELGLQYEVNNFLSDYVVEILSDIVLERDNGSLLFD